MPIVPMTPEIYNIDIFDATKDKKIKIEYDSNYISSVSSVTFTIQNNDSFEYTETQSISEKSFIINENILSNGEEYAISIKLNFENDYHSLESDSILFRCGKINAGFSNIELRTVFSYTPITVNTSVQENGDALQRYYYNIYEMTEEDFYNDDFSNLNLLYTSNEFYNVENLNYTLPVLNNGYYSIRFIGDGIYGTHVETPISYSFRIFYKKLDSNIILEADVKKENGYIALSSFIKNAIFKTENEHYIFNNGILTMDLDNSLLYYGGFDVSGDFLLYLKCAKVNSTNEPIVSLNEGELILYSVKIIDNYYLKLISGNYVYYLELPNASIGDDNMVSINNGAYVTIVIKRVGMDYSLEVI